MEQILECEPLLLEETSSNGCCLQNESVYLNGQTCSVLTCGSSLQDIVHNDIKEKFKCLIYVIPGNPGVIEFYEEFFTHLFELLNQEALILGISHAGHARIPGQPNNVVRYTLNDQVKFHHSFINEYIPKDVKLIFIGHSIGAKIALELQKISSHQIQKSVLLFPTIERMSETPNGKLYGFVLKYLRLFLICFAVFTSCLPKSFKFKLLKWHLKDGDKVPDCIVSGALNLMDPNCLRSCIYMALNEFALVQELDYKYIKENLSKFIFYYGHKDSWVPLSYPKELIKKFDSADIYICKKNIDHAFVVKHSKEMAAIVASWINDLNFQSTSVFS